MFLPKKMNLSIWYLLFQQDIRSTKSDKVSVVLYYEALCGGCHDWITTELVSTYEKLGKYMDFEFVPYGNAHVSLILNDHILGR